MAKQINSCNLRKCPLCLNSLPGWLSAIAANRTNIRFSKGQAIFKEGDAVEGIYFLYTGKAKVHKRWGEVKELIIRFAREGEMIGYRGLGNENVYPVTATALEPLTVCFVQLSFFEETLLANREFTYYLMKFFANELQEAESRMRNLALMDVQGRLADTLLQLKEKFGTTEEGYIDIMLTRQDIASFAGTTYETVFRTMAVFLNKKFIRVAGKKITILKEGRLKELASQ